ncbi:MULTISPECIES: AAA family ATPase [Pseudomonas]|jgi:energy-coupling factor transporter ATP-binding protein EcfA2|uniref:AAA family ATPase n=1 Tax=Pseudomonas TaxID=286 RepID=UPI0009536D35|nr:MULTISPECIES: AAA family ATPase [Pseudomonas]WLG65432.1 AAA family ATPase [Pseudomonas brassicacearum]SIS02692.1 AAA domain-containing protein [Pseudomonas sp. A214]
MQAQVDIRSWLLKQNDWLQEAADRLLKKGEIDALDVADLTALIKTPAGSKPSSHREFAELSHRHTVQDELRLIQIGEVAGIENLEPRRPLEFGSHNLSVIYGHNGSGKSSYTRILKKLSGKPRAAELKTNVFKTAPPASRCQVTSELNGQQSAHEWHVGQPLIEALRNIDIFDSDEASHYLTAESAATYIPSIVGLFEKLAVVVEQVREALAGEQSKLVTALPQMPAIYDGTPGKRFYEGLGAVTPTLLNEALTWKPEDESQLTGLIERLKAEDPGALAVQRRRTKAELQKVIFALSGGAEAYSDQSLKTIRGLRQSAQQKRQTAVEGAKIKTAELEGVGLPTWKAMWDAARAFSASPYPHDQFPVTHDQARCPLCHQTLDEQAQHRLQEFEAFVQGKLETDAKNAESLYDKALERLPKIPTEQEITTQCEAAGLGSKEWPEYLKAFWLRASQARAALHAHEAVHAAQPVAPQTETITSLTDYQARLDDEAAQYEADAVQFDRVQASKERLGLEARKWITEQAVAVRAEVERLKKSKAYDAWKALTSSRAISTKAAEVTQAVVTEAYVGRFNQELRALGAHRIQVELIKTRARNGVVLHQVRLKGAQDVRTQPQGVLSEGERRIISLAAFLADVCEKPGAAPFVFDDPISSLDHEFEWAVACRLVALAQTRQVIVLTHRLSLYGVLEDLARKVSDDWKSKHYRPMRIESYGGVAGHPSDQDVWSASTKKANNILLTRLTEARKAGDVGGADAYRALAQGICSEFRKLVERSVEEDLLNKVVLRHRRGIQTDGRLRAIQGIKLEDCRLIDDLMTKYSCYEHSQSTEIPMFIPEEAELRVDLEALSVWREQLSKRRDAAA